MIKRFTFIFLLLSQLLFARWGWGSHRFINHAAVDRLPVSMSFFQDHRNYLTEHSVDPDQDSDPSYYHYIDIDHYDEFFSGELPTTYEGMIELYGQEVVEEMGVVPWVIEWWLEDLTNLMIDEDWANVWQVAAELGHYVADSHQALHLTVNYNGAETGNWGIHSRYETDLMNMHLAELHLPDTVAGYWETPIDSILGYIEDIYPIVELVMAADDQGYAADPNHGTTYYNIMWSALGDTSIWSINKAVVDLASLWYTAWINAGSPYPMGAALSEMQQPEHIRLQVFPNPFNGQTRLHYTLSQQGRVELSVYNLKGQKVRYFDIIDMQAGTQELIWDGRDQYGQTLETGVFIVQIESAGETEITKVSLLK